MITPYIILTLQICGCLLISQATKMPFNSEDYIAMGVALILGAIITAIFLRMKNSGALTLKDAEIKATEEKLREVEKNLATKEIELTAIRKQTVDLMQREAELKTRIDAERKAGREKEALLQNAQVQLGDTFKALSSEALRANQKQFLQLAESSMKAQQDKVNLELDKRKQAVDNVVQPISQTLEKMQGRIGEIEKAREGAYASIKEQVLMINETQLDLRKETSQLVKALRQPTGRGQWGEIQLKRVVEMAGMQEHCDFSMQVSKTSGDGNQLRPDLVVDLPGGHKIVVDAKTPMAAYLDAIDTKDEVKREALLDQHAGQVRTQISQLANKKYSELFGASPEFVILFLPSEAIFSAALAKDPTLIEKGIEKGIILATPTTLIALLRTIAYGWRQQDFSKNAEKISQLGKELYGRITTFSGFFNRVGANLSTMVGSYNRAVASFDSRVLSSARKFEEFGAVASPESPLDAATVDSAVRESNSVVTSDIAEIAQSTSSAIESVGFEPAQDFASPDEEDFISNGPI